MKKLFCLLVCLTALTFGCKSGSTVKAEKPPEKMERVQFLVYDDTPRTMTPHVEIYDTPPANKYKVIALITCEGAYHEEIVMTKAIVFKARQLGADAIIRLDAATAETGNGSMYGFSKGGRSLFRANAIVFEKE